MIDFEHVSKEYKKGGRLALEDIDFHVDDGEFVSFWWATPAPASPLCSSSSSAKSCPPPAR